MTAPFAHIGTYYDLLYDTKDYQGEALFVDKLLRDTLYLPKPWSLLDLACGSARHTIEFARLGYCVAGSEPAADMRALARRNSQRAGLVFPLFEHPFQSCNEIERPFEAVTSLFASFGYLVEDSDVVLALKNICGLLVSGGVFIFDVWNAQAVRSSYQAVKVLEKENAGLRLRRTSTTKLDLQKSVAEVRFEIDLLLSDGDAQKIEEMHHVRFFEIEQLQGLLAAQGFKIERVVPFGDATRTPQEMDWSVTFVCRKA